MMTRSDGPDADAMARLAVAAIVANAAAVRRVEKTD